MTLIERKSLIARFLGRCNRYADGKIDEYRSQLEGASARRALELQDMIGHWTSYRAFNEYTIDELGTERLDDWLEEPAHD